MSEKKRGKRRNKYSYTYTLIDLYYVKQDFFLNSFRLNVIVYWLPLRKIANFLPLPWIGSDLETVGV